MMRFVLGLVDALFNLYYLALLARVVLSWLPHPPAGRFVEIIHRVTEPLLSQVRRIIPPAAGGVDFSPYIGLLFLWFLQSVLINLLSTLAWGG